MDEPSHLPHSLTRDRAAVAFHYDAPNEFFRLWLDDRMLYSCAYFHSEYDDIDSAQTAKMMYLARKLRLKRGQRVLDLGCGWGGLAIFLARHCDVNVLGITLSHAQATYATDRVALAGLGDKVTIRECDYRDLKEEEAFDAVVSVGMAEHVGLKNLPAYFKTGYNLLKPGGIFLNHAISEGVRLPHEKGPSFIHKYVFPDSEIPPLSTVARTAESAGFEIRDVENLREHYVLTLRRWVQRLEKSHETAIDYVSEPSYRVWRLYMAGCAHGFERGSFAIYQTLLSKPDANGKAHLPLTRGDWYSSYD